MKQKAVGLALTAVLSLGIVFGGGTISSVNAEDVVPVEVIYTDVVSGKECTYLAYYKDLYFADNSERMQVAKLSMALSAQAYAAADVTADVLESMGFTVVAQENYNRVPTSADCNFVVYTIAKREIGEETLYGVFIRGTASDAQWYSNFNVGQHEKHDGFNAAASEVNEKLNSFLAEEKNAKVWVTGHSRGGAVANLLGDRLNRSEYVEQEDVCVYTFASPATTTKPIAYDNIFNYYVPGDVIAEIPLEKWGYSVYGTEHIIDDSAILKKTSTTFTEWTGLEFVGGGDISEFISDITYWVPSRSAYYKKDANLEKAPVDIMTEYLVPFLIHEEGYSLGTIVTSWITNSSMLTYMLRNPGFINTMYYFAEHSNEIVQSHAPVTYMALIDAAFPHEHEYDEYTSNKDETCVQDGTLSSTCFCGEVSTIVNEGSALGHDYQAPVKGEDKLIHYCCSRCDAEIIEYDLAECTLAEPIPEYEYLGVKIEPEFVLLYDGEIVSPECYDFEYQDTNGVGTAKIHLVAKGGGFWGEKTITYTIRQHEHNFNNYIYQKDATCLTDGTEISICDTVGCDERDVRTAENTALDHQFEQTEVDARKEHYVCVRNDADYYIYHIATAKVDVDPVAFFMAMDSGNYFIVGWDDFTVDPSNYQVVSVSYSEKEEYVILNYVIEGIGDYKDTIEGTLKIKYIPNPDQWIVRLTAGISTALGICGIVGGVYLGIRRRKG